MEKGVRRGGKVAPIMLALIRAKHPPSNGTWGMGDVINALIAAGLRIDFVHEFDRLFYKGFPNMVKDEEGWWYLPEYRTPLSFSLKATKDFT